MKILDITNKDNNPIIESVQFMFATDLNEVSVRDIRVSFYNRNESQEMNPPSVNGVLKVRKSGAGFRSVA